MQDAARDIKSAALQKPKGQEAARQAKVDSESVALQKPETQEAVKQVQVDAESAQLQKPETQQVTHRGVRAVLTIQQSVYVCCWSLRTGRLSTFLLETCLSGQDLSGSCIGSHGLAAAGRPRQALVCNADPSHKLSQCICRLQRLL